MDKRNFGSDVSNYLAFEQAFLCAVLRSGAYRHAVELGCDVARCFEAVDSQDVQYLGIDVRPELAMAVEEYFNRRRAAPPRLIIGSANDLALHLRSADIQVGDGVVCVFPFNLLGNIEEPERLLAAYRKIGVDVIVSGFATTDHANEVRRSYYENCGIANLQKLVVPEGTIFTNFNDFYSISYHANVVINKLQAAGYEIGSRSYNQISFIAHAMKDRNSI